MILMILVTLPALLAFAKLAASFPPEAVSPVPEAAPIIGSQIHPQSGTIEMVETRSSQKKNE